MAIEERTEGWQRRLGDGRVEIFVRADDMKVRAHGTEAQMNELLDWFESQSGRSITAPWRQRVGPTPIAGQLDLLSTLGTLV